MNRKPIMLKTDGLFYSGYFTREIHVALITKHFIRELPLYTEFIYKGIIYRAKNTPKVKFDTDKVIRVQNLTNPWGKIVFILIGLLV